MPLNVASLDAGRRRRRMGGLGSLGAMTDFARAQTPGLVAPGTMRTAASTAPPPTSPTPYGDDTTVTAVPTRYGYHPGRGATPPPAPTPGVGTQYPGGFPNVPGSTETNPFGYPGYTGLPTRDKRKMSRWQKRSLKNMPPWMQDPSMFTKAIGSITDILGQRGQISPERIIREQSDIEVGRGQAQDALSARLAAAGIDPGSPEALSMGGLVEQGANRAQAENRRQLDIEAEERWRRDLQLVTPYLQMILGMTGPKGATGVQAAPVGGGGAQNTDWAGILSNLGSSFLQGYGSSLGKG